jgi:hypothetical protein
MAAKISLARAVPGSGEDPNWRFHRVLRSLRKGLTEGWEWVGVRR